MEQYLIAMTVDHPDGGVRPDIVDCRQLLEGLDRSLFGDLAP